MTSLEEALSELKRRGSASLVVGAVPHELYVRVSRRMLGAGDEPPRRRLLVVPDDGFETAVDRLRATGPVDPAHAQVVTCNGASRSASVGTDPGEAGESQPPVRWVDGSLRDLGATITETIERFDAAAGGLDPAELRVGVDPLPSLLSAYDTTATFAFLHVLTEQVRRADGMGHVRLDRGRDTPVARTLAPLFDAVLELRVDGYRLEQRWHLREYDIVSDWLVVPEADDPD